MCWHRLECVAVLHADVPCQQAAVVSQERGGSSTVHSLHDWHSRSARDRYVTCKHQKQNGHTWGWRLARGALATWMSSRAERRAQGARPARVAPARAPRAPASYLPRLHRSAEPWLAPGRAIQLRVVRCIADVARPAGLASDRSRLWVLFITVSLSPLFLLGPRARPPQLLCRQK